MKNQEILSVNSVDKQELTTLTHKEKTIVEFVVLANERTLGNLTDLQIVKTSVDIANEFKDLDIETIKLAMRKGGLGKFGRSYKLSTQEICIWIREELNSRKTNDVHSRVFF